MASYDVTVRGAGIFGLASAWACAQRGARVRVIDPGGPGAGASGGVVGALAPHAPENWTEVKAFQRDCLLEAPRYWAEVARVSGVDPGFAAVGRLQPIPDAAALARATARAEAAAQLWTGRARWSVIGAEAAGPWAPISATGLLVEDTLSARLAPAQACAALAAAVTSRGGEVVADGAEVGPVIEAMGATGLAALSERLGRPVGTAVKGQAAVLGLDRRGAPQLYADGLHIVPHADGTVAVGSTSEREFAVAETTDAGLDGVIARARAACPALAEAPVLRRWAGLRPRAKSRAPLLGPIPGAPGRFVANGGFKIGFAVAPGVAEMMADLVLEGRDRIPAPFQVAASL